MEWLLEYSYDNYLDSYRLLLSAMYLERGITFDQLEERLMLIGHDASTNFLAYQHGQLSKSGVGVLVHELLDDEQLIIGDAKWKSTRMWARLHIPGLPKAPKHSTDYRLPERKSLRQLRVRQSLLLSRNYPFP